MIINYQGVGLDDGVEEHDVDGKCELAGVPHGCDAWCWGRWGCFNHEGSAGMGEPGTCIPDDAPTVLARLAANERGKFGAVA